MSPSGSVKNAPLPSGFASCQLNAPPTPFVPPVKATPEAVGGRLAVPSLVSDHAPGPSTPPMARTCASYVAPASRPGRVRLVGVAGSSLISVPGLFGSSYL